MTTTNHTSPSGEDGQPSDSKPAAPTQGDYPTLQFAHYEAFEEAGRIVDKEMAEFRKLYGTRAAASKRIGEDASNGATKLLDAIISDLEGGFVRCQHCGEQEDTATLDVVPMLRDLRNLLTANGAIGEREAFEHWCKTHCGLCDRDLHQTIAGAYRSGYVDDMWDGWQARAALTAEKVAAEPVAVPERLPGEKFSEWAKRTYESQPARTQVALTGEQREAIATGIEAMTTCGWTHRIPVLVALLAAQPVSGGKS